jgi:hypothetical protein
MRRQGMGKRIGGMKKKVTFGVLFVLIAITLGWTFLIERNTDAFIRLFCGCAAFVFGVSVLIREIMFLRSPKDLVIGEIVRLHAKNTDDGTTFLPIFRYTYDDEEWEFISNISFLKVKKMEPGTKSELVVLKKNPNIVRLNELLLLLILTLISLALIVIGILLALKGIRLLG